jgi:hypothetical protein
VPESEARRAYLERMKGSRQFEYFGIRPLWRPGEQDIMGFCHDEVVRQWHNTRVRSDGGIRVDWMMRAWDYARDKAKTGVRPDPDDIQRLAAYIEPDGNRLGWRLVGVTIAGQSGAPAGMVPYLMEVLYSRVYAVEPVQGLKGASSGEYRSSWEAFEKLTADIQTTDDWYLAFEAVHPFVDGNRRTGKVLYNWLLGTLDDPVLVRDYFGGGNP